MQEKTKEIIKNAIENTTIKNYQNSMQDVRIITTYDKKSDFYFTTVEYKDFQSTIYKRYCGLDGIYEGFKRYNTAIKGFIKRHNLVEV